MRKMPQYRQFGQTGSNRRVCVPHKYHLFRIGLLTYTSCSCTVATLSHNLWNKTHEATPYSIRSMHCSTDRIRTIRSPYFTYRTVHIGENVMTAITGDNIDLFRMSVLEKALRLELLGMKGSGRSAYSVIKSESGLKGNKQSVYDQFKAIRLEAAHNSCQPGVGMATDGPLPSYRG